MVHSKRKLSQALEKYEGTVYCCLNTNDVYGYVAALLSTRRITLAKSLVQTDSKAFGMYVLGSGLIAVLLRLLNL